METIFDHNITQEECRYITSLSKSEYLRYFEQESAYSDIAMLYYRRGNKNMYRKYLDKLSYDMREACIRTVTHP